MKQIVLGYMVFSSMVAGFGGIVWIGYTYYLLYRVLHRVDAIVDPETYEHLQRHGDFLAYRLHRLVVYACATPWRWANRRTFKRYDFTQLPRPLRLQLSLHFFGMIAGNFFILTGYLALKLVEHWGMI
jgi:hypothetical protein